MRICVALALAACSALSVLADEKLPLKVLYAGEPGSAREKEFVEFLDGQFTQIGKVDLRTFKSADAERFDVVIFDWSPRYRDASSMPVQVHPKLDADFDRAAVMIGATGGEIGSQQRLKLDWL